MDFRKLILVGSYVVLLTAVNFLTISTAFAQVRVGDDLRSMLLEPNYTFIVPNTLGKLFAIGDTRIAELIAALDDPDEDVAANAELIIRYLGNREGMNAVFREYKTRRKKNPVPAGAIPLPLTDWDLEFVRSRYLGDKKRFDDTSVSYIFALALDGSERSRKLLQKIEANVKRRGLEVGALADIKRPVPSPLCQSDDDLPEALKQGSFFVEPNDRKFVQAKVLAFNENHTKALTEVYLGRGTLAEEWYHVVLERKPDGWRFYSITLFAVS